MAEEVKKPDEQVPAASPEAVVAVLGRPQTAEEAKKEPEKKYEETPEDIKKSKEFFQQQAQEKADELKEAQSEIEQIYADLDAADPGSHQRDAPPLKQEPEKKAPPAEPTLVDELGQPDVAAIIRQEVGKLRDDLTLDFQQKQEKIQQEQVQRDWENERNRTIKAVRSHQKVYNIPDDVFDACDKEASEVVGPPHFLGAHTRWAKVMRRLFDQHQLHGSIAQKAKVAEANASAQIEHAGKVAQPSGSAISPPEPGSLEKWNQQQADDIVDNDPPVG